MIYLKEITKENIFSIFDLSDTLTESEQQSVAPNMMSLAQAYVNQDIAWPRAIYLDDTPIGFIMVALDWDIPEEDRPAYYLWRMMIAKDYQGKGYGKQVLDIIKQKSIDEGMRYLYVTCMMHDTMPHAFYMKYGFEDTLEMDGKEEILKMKLTKD